MRAPCGRRQAGARGGAVSPQDTGEICFPGQVHEWMLPPGGRELPVVQLLKGVRGRHVSHGGGCRSPVELRGRNPRKVEPGHTQRPGKAGGLGGAAEMTREFSAGEAFGQTQGGSPLQGLGILDGGAWGMAMLLSLIWVPFLQGSS